MVSQIRKLLAARPFFEFMVHTTDGGAMRVPTVEHIAVPPTNDRVFNFADDGNYEVIHPAAISRIAVARVDERSTVGS